LRNGRSGSLHRAITVIRRDINFGMNTRYGMILKNAITIGSVTRFHTMPKLWIERIQNVVFMETVTVKSVIIFPDMRTIWRG
jgi:hypothetical protein